MSLKKRLRVLFVCLVLEFGVLSGVPMQVQPKAAHVLPEENKDGDDALMKSDNQIE